jgi:hypothetical protein
LNDDERRFRATTVFANSPRRETRLTFPFGVVVLHRDRIAVRGGPFVEPATVDRAAVRRLVRVRDFEAINTKRSWTYGFEAVDGSYLRARFRMRNGVRRLAEFGWPVEPTIIGVRAFLEQVHW